MNKTTEALKLAEEALYAELESDTCEEFAEAAEKCHKALAAIREALAEQEKQEPVAIVTTRFSDNYLAWDKAIPPAGTKLYAAPVDAKAIRAEALEEAAKMAEAYVARSIGIEMAAAIRGLK